MSFDSADVKKLRDETGAGMMDAKKALEAADGDADKAKEVLREKGQAKARKRSQRQANAGLVEAYVHMGRVGAMVEVNCETDFVAKTDDFKRFVRDVAMQVAASNPEYLSPEDVPEEVIEDEKKAYNSELEGKPESVQKQILDGKLDKFYEQVCLMRQPFIKDPDSTIGDQQTELIAKLGENVKVSRFVRFELGTEA